MRFAFALAIVFEALLAACSGGSGSPPLPNAGAPASAGSQPAIGSATFAIVVPAASTMERVRPNYVSPNTQSLSITLTQANGVAVTSPTPEVVALTPGSPNCSTAASGGTTCSVTSTYPTGSDVWKLALYASTDGTGTPLSINTVAATVKTGSNTVDLTMNPVVASLAFSPAYASCAYGASCTNAVVLDALDASGATIIGPGSYVNSSQSAVTISISPAPSGLTLENSSGGSAVTTGSAPGQLTLADIAYNGSAGSSGGTLTVNASDTNGNSATWTLSLSATAGSSPSPTASPTSGATYYPPDPPSAIRSTYGRIGLAEIFDYFPSTGTQMSSSQISADANNYDAVWASFDPQPWRSSNPSALVSRYYIIEEDNELISGHDLQWWQENHPDWILYACSSNGTPTHDYAYTPGDGFPDVPLDMHNPAVVQYQVQSLISYAQANDYNALALDEVIFEDVMKGGNPELGQTENTSEYGCGIWNDDGTFTTVYTGPTDPTWTADVLNWVSTAKQAAESAGLAVIVNHPVGSVGNSNEQSLLSSVDAEVDEDGFSDYGNYIDSSTFFKSTWSWMEWIQSQGKAFIDIDRYTLNGETSPTTDQIEYSIGTYLMANEGNADLFADANNGKGYGYGAENYYPEYATQLGDPCGAMYEDSTDPQIYYRRFASGMVVVNASDSASGSATLPSDHTYTDIGGRSVTDPLTVSPSDAWVMTTTGNGCT
ncbi:MAG TPA: hypothetical protein VMF11_06945 [Candidatus Baltobacteraceae bacterium]|nr:hypothetical protein [Candidatus Baltobacteraceae bacterium]